MKRAAISVESVPERFSLDVRHHVEEEAVRLAGIEQWQDMRMLQIRRRPDLGQEAIRPDDSSQLGLQYLHGDLAVMPDVLGQEYPRHPALTERTLDAVSALKGGVEAGDGVGCVHAEKMRLTVSIRERSQTVPRTASSPPNAHRRN